MRAASAKAAVIPDPTPLWDDADRMVRRDHAMDALGKAVRGLDVASWSGEAADAFRDYVARVARAVLEAADDAATASRLLRRHADVVAWARDALASTPEVPVEARLAREDELREVVAESAARTAAGLREIAARLDAPADEWDVVRYMRNQYWTGIGEGAVGMVEGLYATSMIRFALEPEAYVQEQISTGVGLAIALRDDPVGLAKSVIDFDTWRTEPVRAAGRLVPDALASAASAGAASGATAGFRGITTARRAVNAVEDASPDAPIRAPIDSPVQPSQPTRRRPDVSHPTLANIVTNIFRGVENPQRVGDGTTMAAVAHELATGELVHGRSHSLKAHESIRGLGKWLRLNPDADATDRAVAEALLAELKKALEGL